MERSDIKVILPVKIKENLDVAALHQGYYFLNEIKGLGSFLKLALLFATHFVVELLEALITSIAPLAVLWYFLGSKQD